MTVLTENATTPYTGNGVSTFFEYGFAFEPEDDTVQVSVDDVLVTNFTMQDTGILFSSPPAFGAAIIIYRYTAADQLRDFKAFEAFVGEKTENAMDKLYKLKQDAASHRRFANLAAIPAAGSVTIENNRGADAVIPLWEQDGTRAGVFSGNVSEDAPADGASNPDSTPRRVWFQYDHDVVVAENTSVAVNATGGWGGTQDDYYGGPPSFALPFENATYDEFTMCHVRKCDTYPSDTQDWGAIGLANGAFGLYVRRQAITNNLYFGGRMVQNAIQRQPIANFTTMQAAGWASDEFYDWLWFGYSFKRSLGKVMVAVVNLETGSTYAAEAVTGLPDAPAEFPTTAEIASDGTKANCLYGSLYAPMPGTQYWRGSLSQTFVHNKYVDFSNIANVLGVFVNADGIINVGLNGHLPFGEQPLVYMPNGHPSDNRGTIYLGDWPTDFYWQAGSLTLDGDLPPVSATP